MRFTLGLILNTMLFILSWVIPKKSGTILCGGGMGTRFSGNPKYLFLHIHKLKQRGENPFKEYHWITKNNNLRQKLNAEELPTIDGLSIYGFWKILRSEFLIIESGPAMHKFGHDIGYQRLFMGRFKIVQTWHGSPSKRILLDALNDRKSRKWYEKIYYYLEKMELKNLWLILAMGEREQKLLQKAFANQRVEILGSAKNDYLLNGIKENQKRLFTQYDKVILYAPTFRETPSHYQAFSDSFLTQLNNKLEERNWIFLLKKHPFDIDLKLNKEYSNIKDVSIDFDDIQTLLIYTDLLITDYSSIYVDFLLTKKDIIFYIYDYNEFQVKSRSFYYDMFKNPPASIAKSQEELLDTIFKINSISISDNYTHTIKVFHKYTDANSSKRLVEYILDRKRGQY